MKCIKCGNELSANAKFCGKCGTSTANMEAAPSASNNASLVGSTVMLGAAAEVHDEEKTVILGSNPIAQAPVQPQPMNMQAMPVQNQQNKKDKKQKKEKKKGKEKRKSRSGYCPGSDRASGCRRRRICILVVESACE